MLLQESSPLSLVDYLAAASAILIALTIIILSKKIVRFFTKAFSIQDRTINILSKILATTAFCLGSFFALRNLGVQNIGPLLGTIGVGGVAIAFALQNLVMNFLGSILIQTRRPFKPGDQIASLEHRGTVIDINTRTVILLTFDGTYVHIPNAKLMQEPFINLTHEDHRRSEINILVAYGTDLKKAAQLASRAARSCEGIVDEMLVDTVVTSFEDSGINLRTYFWHPSEQLETIRLTSDVSIAIYNIFNDQQIEIPLPHLVVNTPNAFT